MSDFCRCSEQAMAEAAANLCKWPTADVPWTLTELLPGYTEHEMVQLLQPYFAKWDRVKVGYVQSASVARVLVGCRFIDGQNGVLADCYLPCGNVRTVKLQFDVGDNWTPEKLGQTAFHEMGHGIGISHAPPNSNNIMAPSLNMAIKGLGEFDRAEQAKRYSEIIVPKPSPPTGGSGMGGLLDLLKKIGPILDLFKDPRFLELIDLIVAIFGGKDKVSADDVDTLVAALQSKAQQIRQQP